MTPRRSSAEYGQAQAAGPIVSSSNADADAEPPLHDVISFRVSASPPPSSSSSSSPSYSCSITSGIIRMPLLLQELFEIEYLPPPPPPPRHDNCANNNGEDAQKEVTAAAAASSSSSVLPRTDTGLMNMIEDDDAAVSIPSDLSIDGDEEDMLAAEETEMSLTSTTVVQKNSKQRHRTTTTVRKLASRVFVRQASNDARRRTKQQQQQRKRHESEGSDVDPTCSSPTNDKTGEQQRWQNGSHHSRSGADVVMNESYLKKLQTKLQRHKTTLELARHETLQVEAQVQSITSHITQLEAKVMELEETLSTSIKDLEHNMKLLQRHKRELKELDGKRNKTARAVQDTSTAIARITATATTGGGQGGKGKPPLCSSRSYSGLLEEEDEIMNGTTAAAADRQQQEAAEPSSCSTPPAVVLRRSDSSSFIRVHDLDMETTSSLSLSEATTSTSSAHDQNLRNATAAEDMFFLDNDVTTVVQALARFGYDLATDETSRFVPALNTTKLLSQCHNKQQHSNVASADPSCWPIQPWQAAFGKDVLVWTGSVDHNGHGCDLPVIKARAVIPTTPRDVLDLVLDSSRATEYNKMSQGREDVLVVQGGVDTTADDSDYGIAGEIKIIKSLNKPPLIRRNVEILSLIYARPLEDADGGYLAVNRSVWENSSGTPETDSKDTVRSEIILGVNIFRPVRGGRNNDEQYCELTTITHAHSSLVPDAIARKMGPTQAATFMKDVQAIFSKR